MSEDSTTGGLSGREMFDELNLATDYGDFAPAISEGPNEDDDDGDFPTDDPIFVDFDQGTECLHDTEDIDFEFVYALHTFVATVEGQANATKGDTMVLLDDSNSYWWLVRVVKDSSIGRLAWHVGFWVLGGLVIDTFYRLPTSRTY